jgi:3',5'-cyclic-AMP phosphodiesterase
LPPLSRRRFLVGALAAGAGLAGGRLALGAERRLDPHRFALLADTHISGKRDELVRGVRMAANLERVSGEILALSEAPSAMFINGDCAYLSGQSEDYATLVELLRPSREAGLPVHLALGNHDHRERFWSALPRHEGQPQASFDRHLSVIRSPHANWLVLDSLDETNKTPGVLGERQLNWLEESLRQHPDKPALVIAHHNPDERPNTSGLVDTKELVSLFERHTQVKAFFYGHTHNWQASERGGVHFINLPPVAYVFAEGKPNGWVDARLTPAGATLELRCLDVENPQHGEKVELTWRA